MTIQIATMKYTGQQIIADIGEVYQDKESKEEGARPICLSFTEPYALVMEDTTAEGYNLRFDKWNPFTDETQFHVGFDLVGMIFNPKPAILEAYRQKIQKDAPKPEGFDPALQPNVPAGFSPIAVPEGVETPELNPGDEVQMFDVDAVQETNEEVTETV